MSKLLNVRAGMLASVAAIALAVGGLVTAVAVIVADGAGFAFLAEDFVPQIAAIGIGFGLLARVVLPRDPDNLVLWVYALVAVLSGVFVAATAISYAGARLQGIPLTNEAIGILRPVDVGFTTAFSVMVGAIVISPAIFWLLSLGILLFPDGRLPSTRWRWVVWLAVLGGFATGAILGYLERPASTVAYDTIEGTDAYDEVISVPLIALLVASVLSFFGLLVRFRRSVGVERQQIRWILFGTALAVGSLVAAVLLSGAENQAVIAVVVLIALVLFMGCFWVALTRYRLYDIDIVISRTFVYGALAVFIGAVYVGVVVGVGALFGDSTDPNPILAVLATAVVAVAFQPLRVRLQKIANRIVYGRKATPYEVLSEFSRQVAATDSSLVESVARSLAEGTAALKAEVWSTGGSDLRRVSAWPESGEPGRASMSDDAEVWIEGADVVFPIEEGGELLGAIGLAMAPGQQLSAQDRELAQELTSGVGLALRNTALTARLQQRVWELRGSRQRIVALQDETRRTLERDLHDGAQQRLVALKVKLGLANQVAARDGAEKTAEFLSSLAEQADEAIAELRAFARGIYPPLLEAEGLVAALRSEAARSSIAVDLAAHDVGRYPKEIESTVYFCVLAAIENIVVHSGAASAQVTIAERDRFLQFSVRDAGSGYDTAATRPGRGITNMIDRLDAAEGTLTIESEPGSGTTVTGTIPVHGGAG